MGKLDGKVAVIVGADDLGKAVGVLFAKEGASVVLGDVDASTANAAAEEVNKVASGKGLGLAVDVTKRDSTQKFMDAAAQKFGMFLCVQDLTCPGASLIHSAGLAAHIPGVAAIEANARQYVPAANKPWEAKFPGIFSVTDGQMRTSQLAGPGLGAL